jgi:hypothetical protein
MLLISGDDGGPSEERTKWIGDDNLAAQTPGIMTSRRTAAARTGLSSPRSSRPANYAAYLADVITRIVNNGPTRESKISNLWS